MIKERSYITLLDRTDCKDGKITSRFKHVEIGNLYHEYPSDMNRHDILEHLQAKIGPSEHPTCGIITQKILFFEDSPIFLKGEANGTN